jgi:HAMP domain-containing protein
MFILKKIRWNVLFFFLTAASIPLFLISFLTLREVYRELEKNIINENNKMASQVKNSIVGQLGFFKKQLSSLGNISDIKTFDREKQSPVIKNFFKLNSFFYNIHIYDSSGVLKNIEYPGGFNSKMDLIDNQGIGDLPEIIGGTIKTAMSNKEAAISELFINSYGESAICIAAPIFEFGSDSIVSGVVSAAAKISDSAFHRFLDHVKIYNNEYILIVNSSKEVLTMRGKMLPDDLGRFEFDIYKNGRKIELFNQDPRAGFLEGSSGDAVAFAGGRKDLIFIAPIRVLNSAVIIGRPYHSAFWGLRSIIRYIIWALFLALIIAAALSALVSERIARPIEALVRGLNKAGRGIYSQKIEHAGEDEIGEAVNAFNKLTKKLHQHSVIDSFWREKWRE